MCHIFRLWNHNRSLFQKDESLESFPEWSPEQRRDRTDCLCELTTPFSRRINSTDGFRPNDKIVRCSFTTNAFLPSSILLSKIFHLITRCLLCPIRISNSRQINKGIWSKLRTAKCPCSQQYTIPDTRTTALTKQLTYLLRQRRSYPAHAFYRELQKWRRSLFSISFWSTIFLYFFVFLFLFFFIDFSF